MCPPVTFECPDVDSQEGSRAQRLRGPKDDLEPMSLRACEPVSPATYNLSPMPKLTAEIPNELSRQIDRIIRDGWFPDHESVVREALLQFVDAKSFLGDSPRMLHRFAADALNDSKPEVALKFTTRALSLLANHNMTDFALDRK